MKSLEKWLTEDCNAFDVYSVKLTIGKETWGDACYYKQHLALKRRNAEIVDKIYEVEAFYCIGDLPKDYRHSNHFCFPYESREWFIAGCMLKENFNLVNRGYYPFGIHFILQPWISILDEAIDKHEGESYKRINLIVKKQ
jgi:hypothetical protein